MVECWGTLIQLLSVVEVVCGSCSLVRSQTSLAQEEEELRNFNEISEQLGDVEEVEAQVCLFEKL